jgi:hypothetical protein
VTTKYKVNLCRQESELIFVCFFTFKRKERRKMLISILFVSIIIVYGFIGLKKGGIKSIGGLISMILSFILSRCLAIPVTQYVCNESGISDKISSFIQSINGSVSQGGNAFNLGFVNLSAEKLLSSFIMILLFSLFMFIFGLIIHLISSAVKIVPLGEKLDKSIGFISGVVKGLIMAIIVYFILYTVNMIPNVHIPLDNTVLNNVMQMIGGF